MVRAEFHITTLPLLSTARTQPRQSAVPWCLRTQLQVASFVCSSSWSTHPCYSAMHSPQQWGVTPSLCPSATSRVMAACSWTGCVVWTGLAFLGSTVDPAQRWVTPSPHLPSPPLTSPHLSSPPLTSPHLPSPPFTSPTPVSSLLVCASSSLFELRVATGSPMFPSRCEPTHPCVRRPGGPPTMCVVSQCVLYHHVCAARILFGVLPGPTAPAWLLRDVFD